MAEETQGVRSGETQRVHLVRHEIQMPVILYCARPLEKCWSTKPEMKPSHEEMLKRIESEEKTAEVLDAATLTMRLNRKAIEEVQVELIKETVWMQRQVKESRIVDIVVENSGSMTMTCKGCKANLQNTMVKCVDGMKWHFDCFKCDGCQTLLDGRCFETGGTYKCIECVKG